MASLFLLFLCFLLLQLPLVTFSQSYRNITLGSSLSSQDENPYWESPSGDFAFGFHPQQDLFLLAIWFAKIPLKNNTIVWTANNGYPVARGAKVQLTSTGVLSLTTPNGTEIWSVKGDDGSQVSYAAMLDSGNFVLSDTESTFAWASFDTPTDTILPTQILDRGTELSSRLTEDNYTIGRFEFRLQDDGNLVLYTMARPTNFPNKAYWASDTINNGSQLIFNQSGDVYLTRTNGSIFDLSSERPLSTRDYYQRATLDFDGVFRQYTYPKTSPRNGELPSSWSTSWSLPQAQDICAVGFGEYGSWACGLNSYCRLGQDERPECRCPPGYSYLDPKNTLRGCKPNFLPQSCGTNESRITDGFKMQELLGTDWPKDDYEGFPQVSEDWCAETCLHDCFCAVAIVHENSCWLKKFPLSSGSTRADRKALIKVGNSSTDHIPSIVSVENNEKSMRWILPLSIGLGISAIANLLLLFACHRKQTDEFKEELGKGAANLRSFTYKEIKEATDEFKEELGKGAFSTVYKGVLKSDGGCLVAVKRLDKVVEGTDKEFKAEMAAIGKTNHKNLVQLLGFCDEEGYRFLVYEFMKNRSLETFIFESSRLDWNQRIQIAFGIARGLVYLHEDCSSQIIHCDIKPQNILLDDSYTAKISDFGLAKLLQSDQTRTTTGIRGTRGYVAPEWFKNVPITSKVDVYSFGIMLLEIICCRKNIELEVGNEDIEILSDWAYDCCARKELHLLVGDDEKAKTDSKNLEKLVLVALWCIQEVPSLRPSMKKVSQMLEGVVEVPMPPAPSSFISSTS